MFFAIGFETTAPSTALMLMRAKARRHLATSRCSRITSPSSRRFAPFSIRRTCASMPLSDRDTFPPSSDAGRMSGSRSNEGKPIVVSGFEPVDILQSIVMLLRQLRDGRSESGESVQARGAVGGQSRRAEGHG